ncbi:hypothetical protein OpiT1DRAFT_01237 [Opitutaceae bacterium TAV1]|nr:hypothetical protein OpiT1DRAFT_01237 [Opitutaceae bacterium TAV1]
MKKVSIFFCLCCATAWGATPIKDARLTGDATIPDGSTLTIASGGLIVGWENAIRFDGGVFLSSQLSMPTVPPSDPPVVMLPAASGTLALTSDLASYVPSSRTISAAGLATGGGSLSANRTITVTAANTAEATGGTATNRAMTPAATRAAIDGRAKAAVFTIPLGGSYTDFELKISTTNFTGVSPKLYIYYHSPDPAQTSITQYGPTPDVYFTDSGYSGTGGDHRSYRKQSANQSIWQMRSDSNAVIPTVKAVVPVDATVRPTNADLVYVYCRIGATDYERDAAGRVIWYQVEPSWVYQLPSYLP